MKKPPVPAWFLSLWDGVQTSFWFLPSTMAGGAVALSFLLVRVDIWLGPQAIHRLGWIYWFGPEGARAVLSTIAGSMITVAGLTFSITMLTLQLASSQFGPRLLRSFMRDRGNQLVLGTFTSTFLYCLFVLRTVQGTANASFVPHLSVAFGVILATLSLAVLIYFIHHVANAIRIETVLAKLAVETRTAIDRLYPSQRGSTTADIDSLSGTSSLPDDFVSLACAIRAEESGYIQRMDEDALVNIAGNYDLVVRIDAPPGRFIAEGDVVLRVTPSAALSKKVAASLRDTFAIGSDRTPMQDIHYSLRRIVDIAQRALSPGVNDPTTAICCIERLGEVLCRLAGREIPAAARHDGGGCLRLVVPQNTFAELACPAIAAIARYGIGDADVIGNLLNMAAKIGDCASPDARLAIHALSDAILAESRARLVTFDRELLPSDSTTARPGDI